MVSRYILTLIPIFFLMFIKMAMSCPRLPANQKANPSDLKASLVLPMFLHAGGMPDTKYLPFWLYPKILSQGGAVKAAVGIDLSKAKTASSPVKIEFLISTHKKCYELGIESDQAKRFWRDLKVDNVRDAVTKEYPPNNIDESFHKAITALLRSTKTYTTELELLFITDRANHFKGIAILAKNFDEKTIFYDGNEIDIPVWEQTDNKNLNWKFWEEIKNSTVLGYGKVGSIFKGGSCSSGKTCLMLHNNTSSPLHTTVSKISIDTNIKDLILMSNPRIDISSDQGWNKFVGSAATSKNYWSWKMKIPVSSYTFLFK